MNNELGRLIDICHSNLKNSKKHISYLKSRGVTQLDISKNRVGYFPQNVSMLSKYVPSDLMVRKNIISMDKSSYFSDYFNLIIPIYSEFGSPIGISGRTLLNDEERSFIGIPKYKNSSYKKSNILFGLNNARSSILSNNNVYVVEGYFDQISLARSNVNNCVAICGTAFSNFHFLNLAKYTDKITFILDNDDAGVKSMERIYHKYSNKGIKIRFLKIPNQYKDIDEMLSCNDFKREDFLSVTKTIVPGIW